MKTLLLILAFLPSCSTTIPPGTVLSATSGKKTVGVSIGGLTWKDALKSIGLKVIEVGGPILANYALSEVQARLHVQPGK